MPLKLKFFWLGSAIVLSALVLVASLLPTEHIPAGNDKVQHFLSYAVLAGWWFLVVQARLPKERAFIVIFLILFGGLIEILQGMTGYREADFADAFANSLGVLSMALLMPQFVHNWFVVVDDKVSSFMAD